LHSVAQEEPISMCDAVAISVNVGDTTTISLYHPGYFLFGATSNTGGYQNVCQWTVTSMDGTVVHEDVTTGIWEEQSFTLFETTVGIEDSMIVELILSSPLEEFDCCMVDTLVWTEVETIPGFFYGTWDNLNGENTGVDCGGASGVAASPSSVAAVMYPNPASDVVWLDHDGSVAAVRVVDAAGRCVLEEDITSTHNPLMIAQLPEGVYSVMLFDRAGQSRGMHRFVKVN
ncbi:MAG: T9SS type A sorting domain-containing protein, partial [Flavobacteriales bacterium]